MEIPCHLIYLQTELDSMTETGAAVEDTDELLDGLKQAFRDIAEGRYDTDRDTIRRKIAQKRARQ